MFIFEELASFIETYTSVIFFFITNKRPKQRWSPRGQILKSLALASRPQVLENWPVLGSRTALIFGKLKFCGAVEKFFGKRFFVEIA